MNINRILVKFAILPLMVLGLISCNSLTIAIPIFNHPQTIGKIKQHQPDTNISLTGTVTQVAPFLTGGAYQLQDNTGSIWVIRETDLPQKGDQIKIKGLVKQENIAIENKKFSEYYLIELSANSQINNNSLQQMLFPHQ